MSNGVGIRAVTGFESDCIGSAGRFSRLLFVLAVSLFLVSCTSTKHLPGKANDVQITQPELAPKSETALSLDELTAPKRVVDVAVYSFADKTGKQEPNDNFAKFSKAVTQGGEAVLIDVLKAVGSGHWFNVVERVGLNNVLNERNIIDQSNRAYKGTQQSTLPPLRFAGLILEGGIVEYDSNTVTGGAGARLLGIGGSFQHRRDIVTVALRAVSVKSGEVLTSVNVTKTVYSTLIQGSVFKFVAVDEILELDAGYTRNEPTSLATRQAMELAVFSLIIEGARNGLWSFKDKSQQARVIELYDESFKRTQIAQAK